MNHVSKLSTIAVALLLAACSEPSNRTEMGKAETECLRSMPTHTEAQPAAFRTCMQAKGYVMHTPASR